MHWKEADETNWSKNTATKYDDMKKQMTFFFTSKKNGPSEMGVILEEFLFFFDPLDPVFATQLDADRQTKKSNGIIKAPQ